MMDKKNLLDLIRTFALFTTNDKGQTIKILGRYQQFRAVKLAVHRLLAGKTPRQRSGIKRLKDLLRADTSDLVMAMIHKFREADLSETFPLLNDSPHILIMTDEAHRSQYKILGANLDKGLPYATKIGYTGTPIDKTERVFGDYIDKYTMRQAIDDGVTLEIVYEGRTHNAEVNDQAGMDQAFTDIFSDYNLKERLEILGYGSRNAYLKAESTIISRRQVRNPRMACTARSRCLSSEFSSGLPDAKN